MVVSRFRLVLLLLGGFWLLASPGPAGLRPVRAGDNMMDQMIRKFCLKAVHKEIADSGKPAPEGMADDTCNCVVLQMKKRQSVETAKTICKQQAAQKYEL